MSMRRRIRGRHRAIKSFHDGCVTLQVAVMRAFLPAFGVHLLTASGAVLAMLALLAAAQENWSTMYLWLVVALIVDGIDGPLARKVDVSRNAPQWDGVLLDLIIDYLTYVFIPAYALFVSGLFPGWSGWFCVGLITFTAALYFADTRMKTEDKSFSGFPGCWNMVVLVFFAVEPGWVVMLVLVILLSALQFFPVKFIHPVRTKRWRMLSLPLAVLWTICAGLVAWFGFSDVPGPILFALVGSSIYLIIVGAVQQLLPVRSA